MSARNGSVLVVGYSDPQNGPFDAEAIKNMVYGEAEKAKDAGYDMVPYLSMPDVEGVLDKWKELLRSRRWVAIVFGGGVRMDFGNTDFFEDLVNAAVTETEGNPLLLFQTSPDGTLARLARVFPDAK